MRHERCPLLATVRSAVERELRMTRNATRSKVRTRSLARARWVIMAVLREYGTGLGLLDIGRLMDMDHTSVLYGLRQMQTRPELRALTQRVLAEIQSDDEPEPELQSKSESQAPQYRALGRLEERLRGEIAAVRRTRKQIDYSRRFLGLPPRVTASSGAGSETSMERPEIVDDVSDAERHRRRLDVAVRRERADGGA